MEKSLLQEKLKTLEDKFTELNKAKADHEKQAQDIEAELFRLQGDFRTIQDLLKDLDASTDPQPDADPATTVVAKEKKEVASAAK